MDGFDPRIVEHILQGFDKSRPHSNMLDFGVMVMDETYGRERRHRWFTFRGYKALLSQEDINEAEHELPADLANTGGFTDMPPDLFYDTLEQLHQRQDTDSREEKTKKKRKPPKNPILPDGTVKRGRPRKNQPSAMKRKQDDLAEGDGVDGQARPSKRAKTAAGGDAAVDTDKGTPVTEPAPRKRGRPPKRKPEDEPPATPAPRKRGRPPKNHAPAVTAGPETPATTDPSVSAQGVVSGITRDQAGPLVPPYPEVAERPVRQRGSPETDTLRPVGVLQPTPLPELQLPTPESQVLVEGSQRDANGVRTQWTSLHIHCLLRVLLGLDRYPYSY